MAEDHGTVRRRQTFGLGPDKLRINTVDADGVALAAIQGLNLELRDAINQRLKEAIERGSIQAAPEARTYDLRGV